MTGSSTIRSIEARTIRVPLDVPTSFSTRQVHHRDYAIARVTTEDGARGIGFCYGGSDAGSIVTKAVRELFAPLLKSADATCVEGLWDRMYSAGIIQARTGSAMRAISIVDIALWDRNARVAGMPLHRFLGGFHEESVPAYASGGYYLDGKSPQALGEELASYVAMGFKAVKMKVGRLDPSGEEARIAAAREAIGPDVLLMLDANNAWRDLPTALRYMDRYEAYDPYWIEEPFSPDDIANHARLARRTRIPVATGEIEAGRWRFKELLDQEAAAILQTDAAVCGGISEYRRIGATAASYGVNLCPHWFHDLHVHLVGSAPNGQFVEYFPDDQVLNFRRLIDRQLETRAGRLLLPADPGLGFNFDEEALNAFALDDWA
ncbi:mandelate racemase/muconate lactonizing enzyme family protein [Aurantimonas marianensis]|uniref:Mandelate racemase/muconate lactonizing enzyme family protein n=1 Tax=Aurantimonas marianensis TaxID=2920428 RepID=A0A9X2HDZ5_9HYPH|nr:mandelate racemase/muconate lactonizing enzyme family protein [Aurantimonas marianensis]MCP3055864.1 mandelate racemase/muconate lactonizing enzyme family protein [Aurantimonas marianensis]